MPGIKITAESIQKANGEYFPNDSDQSGLNDGQVTQVDLNPALTASIFPFKKYIGHITSSTTATLTAGFSVTVLENTIGDLVWTHPATGQYVATLVGAFPSADKLFIMSPTMYPGLAGDESGFVTKVTFVRLSTSAIMFAISAAGGDSDDIPLDKHTNEIRVYP